MAEYQTQVIWDDNRITEAQMIAQVKVDGFKQHLAQLRSERYALLQTRQALYEEIMGQVQSRESLLAMFKSEAAQMYPETISADIKSVLKTVGADHPLAQLWGKYKVKLGPMMSQMAKAFNDFKAASRQAVAAEEAEIVVLDEYQAFAQTAEAPVPSVDELVVDLISVEAIPQVDEASVIASISALDLLDPDASAMLMLQAVNAEEQAAEIELASAQRNLSSAMEMPGGMKPVGLLVGGLVLAYILFS